MEKDDEIDRILADLKAGAFVTPSMDHGSISQAQINDFVSRIFHVPWALISDMSSVADFCEGAWENEDEPCPDWWVTRDEAYRRINAEYGLSITYETHPLVMDVLREICKR